MAATIQSTSFNFVHNVHAAVPPKKNINIVGIPSVGMYDLNRRNFRFASFGLTNNRSIRPNSEGVIGSVSVGESQRIWSKKGEAEAEVVDETYDPLHSCMLGKFVEEGKVYRQAFIIRSYDTGRDQKLTMEGLMNLLQEIALNHVTRSGLAENKFGATREMIVRNLTWVVTHVHVQLKKYSSRGDIVEIDTWVDAAGQNGMRVDWIIRDYGTPEIIIAEATSTWATMNKETRKSSKILIPDEVREDIKPFNLNRHPLQDGVDYNAAVKIDKLSDDTPDVVIQSESSDLKPMWTDIDANEHVNNVKYIGWILESVPKDHLQKFNMTSMTLDYRRECKQADVVKSLTSMKETNPPTSTVTSTTTTSTDPNNLEVALEGTHLLRMQANNKDILRARTKWHPKSSSKYIA